MTLITPGDCTLQCGRWLWDDMPWNSPKRPPYWNSTSGFNSDHITAVNMSFCTSLRHFIQIGPPSAEKNDVMSIFKMADLSHLGLKNLPFQQILPTVDFFYLLDCLTITELDRGPITLIILFLVSHFNFLFIPCGRLSWLPVSFLLHIKYTLSYRIVLRGPKWVL